MALPKAKPPPRSCWPDCRIVCTTSSSPGLESSPDQPALIGDGKVWTYGDLPGIVDGAADALRNHGARPGDRIMIVSENSLALAALVLAASALDAWSVVVNPRLSERELDQIRDHCGARLVYYAVEVSELAAAHARRHDAHAVDMGPLGTMAVEPAEPKRPSRNLSRRTAPARWRPCSTPPARPAIRRA